MPGIGETIGKEAFKIDCCAPSGSENIEVFQIGNRSVPRVFCGLWQLSSSAWGSSSLQKVIESLAEYVNQGYTAFDMADMYGDVEAIFYSDPRYLDVLKAMQGDSRVSQLGLCNFDTEHLEIVLREQINIKTNQVQFSLIDSRPTVRMADVCKKHGVKLLTYGTLCGGFLSERWVGKPKPSIFSEEITPSQRKYFEMILSWGGWPLFQTLLVTLSAIAKKHSVGISNVATRWVLDFPYVGAVIVGSRMGISGRAEGNLAVYGWHLDDDDRNVIEEVLVQSRRAQMFEEIGDCGSEHR
ncbi:Aldo keto reductase [Neofusicoccum parvum]|nr:Aldo keto reductase [Neofusicoccum parvum]